MLLPSLEWRNNPFNLETSELKVLNISNYPFAAFSLEYETRTL